MVSYPTLKKAEIIQKKRFQGEREKRELYVQTLLIYLAANLPYCVWMNQI